MSVCKSVLAVLAGVAMPGVAQASDGDTPDTTLLVHRLAVDVTPGVIIHTNRFLKGDNPEERTMNHSFTYHVKYGFQYPPGSKWGQIYKGAYQGVGVALHEFNHQLGNPVSVYLYQGARIATIVPRLTFNYEWNLGLAMGWHPYDEETNNSNLVIGSKVTAYIDADFYLAYRLSRYVDVNAGVSLAHYSNGNTQFPNAGLNTAGVRAGLSYYVNRPSLDGRRHKVPAFDRTFTCDVILYGAWRRRGMYSADGQAYVLPGKYGVMGFNVTPMYNVSHWVNVGASLDGVYDRSANMELLGSGPFSEDDVIRPKANKQMALGLSGRVELVMPFFAINIGLGTNVVNGTDEFKGVYEVAALKVNVTKRILLHIGYTLNDFRNPRYLMLGMGYRFGKVRR